MFCKGVFNKIALRDFIVLVCFFILTPLLISVSTGYSEEITKKRIVILETMPVTSVLENTKWFLVYLKEMGYKDGLNIDIEILKAEGDFTLAERLLKNALSKGRPDLLVTNATLATKTAYKMLKGSDVPILFIGVSDPVGAGLVQKIGRPTGTNITGIVHIFPRQKKIDFVLRLLGNKFKNRSMRVGYIHSTYPSSMGEIEIFKKLTENRKDIVFVPYKIMYRKVPDELDAMLDDVIRGIKHLEGRIDFLWEPQGPFGQSPEYTETLLKHSTMPIILGINPKSVKKGALLSLSPSFKATGEKAAMIADAILNGKNPGEIPVTSPDDFSLGINLKTALDIDIAIPSDIMEMAGENIYR